MDNRKLVPKRRFKEFVNADAWEQRNLENLLSVHSFKPYLAEPQAEGKYVVIQQGDNPIAGFSNGNPFQTYEDIILFGDHTLSLYKPKYPFFVASDGLKILSSQELNGHFLLSLLENYKPNSEGYKRHFSILKEVEVFYPKNTDEQVRIGKYFNKLDNLITLHQRKLDKMKNLKSAYLSEMFPAEGECKPKRRFSGFTDAWEQRNLGELLTVHPFKPYLAEPQTDGTYEVIQQGDNPIAGYANGNPFEPYEDIILFGDHTLSIFKVKGPFFVASDGLKILSSQELEGYFLLSLMEIYKPVSEGYKRHFSILKEVEVLYPKNKDEQVLIGTYFKNIDYLITLHQRKLEKLQNIKKAYLNEMFI